MRASIDADQLLRYRRGNKFGVVDSDSMCRAFPGSLQVSATRRSEVANECRTQRRRGFASPSVSLAARAMVSRTIRGTAARPSRRRYRLSVRQSYGPDRHVFAINSSTPVAAPATCGSLFLPVPRDERRPCRPAAVRALRPSSSEMRNPIQYAAPARRHRAPAPYGSRSSPARQIGIGKAAPSPMLRLAFSNLRHLRGAHCRECADLSPLPCAPIARDERAPASCAISDASRCPRAPLAMEARTSAARLPANALRVPTGRR